MDVKSFIVEAPEVERSIEPPLKFESCVFRQRAPTDCSSTSISISTRHQKQKDRAGFIKIVTIILRLILVDLKC
jgi:hypothetical protein